MSGVSGKLKRGRASLVGGIAVGLCVLALWLLIGRDLGIDRTLATVTGALAALAIGVWIRMADL